jgi:hypothetical protein
MNTENSPGKKKFLPSPSSVDSFLPQINPRYAINAELSPSHSEGTSTGISEAYMD